MRNADSPSSRGYLSSTRLLAFLHNVETRCIYVQVKEPPSSASHQIWQAVRASSAAPYYLDDFKCGSDRSAAIILRTHFRRLRDALPGSEISPHQVLTLQKWLSHRCSCSWPLQALQAHVGGHPVYVTHQFASRVMLFPGFRMELRQPTTRLRWRSQRRGCSGRTSPSAASSPSARARCRCSGERSP